MTDINADRHAVLAAPAPRGGSLRPGCAARCLAILKQTFGRHDDLDRLNAHLRRDAGIDDLELEPSRVTRAPFIR